jgi:hypothetical protein
VSLHRAAKSARAATSASTVTDALFEQAVERRRNANEKWRALPATRSHIPSAIEENPKIETTNLPLQNSVVPKPLDIIETTNRLSAIACGLCSSDKAALHKIESIDLSLGSSEPIEAFKSVFGYDAFSEFSIEIGAYGPHELLQSVLSSLRDDDSGNNGPAKRERKKARKGD